MENPSRGAKIIHSVLTQQGLQNMPCVKTVNNILNRYGCIRPEKSLKHKPFQCFEKKHWNQMQQTDFKGEFRMADGNYCFPLDILDDHSRFAIRIVPDLTTANVVIPTFFPAFREFGLSDSVLSDNGAQFSGFKKGYIQLERWLMDLDVLPIYGRIKHPQTQGKIERLHRTMKQELLNHTEIADINDAREKFAAQQKKYNTVRPHEAFGMRCPANVYVPGRREFREKIEVYEYSGVYHVIKVNSRAYVRFDNWQIYLSETMIGQYVEFRPALDGETFVACYRNFKIAEFDTQDGKLIHCSIASL